MYSMWGSSHRASRKAQFLKMFALYISIQPCIEERPYSSAIQMLQTIHMRKIQASGPYQMLASDISNMHNTRRQRRVNGQSSTVLTMPQKYKGNGYDVKK
jgi:hypothetical protein